MTNEIEREDAAPEDWQTRAEAAEQALGQMQREHGEKLKRAELKIEAVRAGMVDLDGLKLVDLDRVALAEDGSVPDAAAVMAKLKRDKPWLFGGGSSSSTAAVPRAEPARARHARDLSEADWRAARAEMLRRSGG
ncbi:hypothetical protein [Acidiphilium acidophilum]|jgi:hypothetical protein|uniref:Uncharacterized protein n=1 Tax=Acidiphilium acidophilum TaxID=76588 RepID=A0AAW9DU28_ACIAO|nr:hypothetical protein [Acidiphilium acidophilum]MDX5932711.1 hypothetical protein [Acidiphilium acidophilum]MEE3500181.1 hypothetical protein [Acidiphilium acidophilum]GBR74311.1 hypothetical protein AA700_0257 [Acidiphilium acidophilum DSM 700]